MPYQTNLQSPGFLSVAAGIEMIGEISATNAASLRRCHLMLRSVGLTTYNWLSSSVNEKLRQHQNKINQEISLPGRALDRSQVYVW